MWNTIYSLFTSYANRIKLSWLNISVIKCTPADGHGDGAESSGQTVEGVSNEEKHMSRIQDVPGKRGQQEVLQQGRDCRTRTLIDLLLHIWRGNNILLWNSLWALDRVVDPKNEEQVMHKHMFTKSMVELAPLCFGLFCGNNWLYVNSYVGVLLTNNTSDSEAAIF